MKPHLKTSILGDQLIDKMRKRASNTLALVDTLAYPYINLNELVTLALVYLHWSLLQSCIGGYSCSPLNALVYSCLPLNALVDTLVYPGISLVLVCLHACIHCIYVC